MRTLTSWSPLGTSAARIQFPPLASACGSGRPGVPAPPVNFQGGAVNNLVSLEWTAPALGPAATGYTLEVGSTPTSGNDIVTLPLGNVTSFSVNAPTATFYVRLRATNAAGPSEATPTLRIDSGCTAPPGPPPFFSAFVDGSNVDLDWSRAQGNVAGYSSKWARDPGLATSSRHHSLSPHRRWAPPHLPAPISSASRRPIVRGGRGVERTLLHDRLELDLP